jgi:hypothetical protein
MKTIVKKLRYALLLGFLAMSVTAWSQGVPYINKMSVTTQMFLDEMEGNINFDELAPLPTKTTSPGMRPLPKVRRPIVTPDTIDGKVYISATVRIADESSLADLESKGVIVQCTFDNGLLTTLIPIDMIDEVAAIEGVTRINVASYLKPLTKRTRQATNVDDVLTLSNDAVNAGLQLMYDGTGVILGVIEDGIDYQHGAFKDKNGNSRIKGAYCYNGSRVTADWTGSGTLPTTDDTGEDHGTHTSTIAGGSSVIVSGTNVTVTDNHANATYGGMAPGADMFLAGTQLATTYVMNAFQRMCNYADQQGKPLVVSNSWSSAVYSRDGYSDMADVLGQYFGDSHPNRICLFASGNEAGMAIGGQGGGRYVTGASTEASPVGTIVRSDPLLENYYGYQYYSGIQAVAWTRAANAQGIGVKIHVINKNTGALNQSYTYTSTNNGAQNSVTLAGLNMTLYVYFDYVSSNGKHMALFYAPNAKTTSNYVFAIEAYPIGGSSNIIDIFGGDWTYLTGYTSTNGHNWQNGTDDLSMSDEPMNPNVISVGSYVTWNGENSTGDISDFSSYSVEGVGPQGVMHPWITAPGEVIISGLNHYVSANDHGTVTVNNANSPYGEMSGTSMATPAVAGIVALWFQAAQDEGIDLTMSDVKEIMKETAIHDQWTNGAHASHFGNGKIDALAGIEYILNMKGGKITVDPTELTFGGSEFWAGSTESKTVVVTNTTDQALHLTIAGLNASLSGTPFSVTAITNNGNVAAGGGTVTITITYAPTVVSANDQATLTIADDVTVALTGSCIQAPAPYDASVNPAEGTLAYGTVTTGNTVTKTITITNEGSQPFTPVVNVDAPFSASYDQSPLAPGESRTITVTFNPTQEGNYNETLTITASESNDISFTYTVTGTGEAPYIAATVNPTSLEFMGTAVNNTVVKSVTIANTGTMAFTPVINTDNLPATYSVTLGGGAKGTITGSEVAVGGSLNVNVTYSPTAVGTNNGSFTIAIGNDTYTVNVYGSAVEVTDATVADGTTTNTYLPIYGNQYANKQINQMIYPASMLTEIQGKKITSMKFYAERINFSGGAFNVSVGTTTTNTYPNRNYARITGLTTVKTGQAAVSGGTELIINFDQPFEYTGGNLVVDFEVTQTNTNSTTRFYGVNPGGYTSFYSYGTNLNNYGRYTGGGTRLQFLPKVTFTWEAPYVAGLVSPNELTYNDVPIGKSEEQTVTVSNTGTLNFTPVIDTTNLPAEFTMNGSGNILPGGTLDLTVTYTPTDEGPHSGSFTVTIGDQTFTVTVTGNGIVVNNTLTSNTVEVPAFHSDTHVGGSDQYIFTQQQVYDDVNRQLAYDDAGDELEILVKSDERITHYNLMHRDGGNGTWEVASTAQHQGDKYVSGATEKTFLTDETEMWFPMTDEAPSISPIVYYVPVTFANGVITQDNTYGAPYSEKETDYIDLYVSITGSKSSERQGGHWTQEGVEYCVYTPIIHVISDALDGISHVPYIIRAWLLSDEAYDFTRVDGAIVGTTKLSNPYLLGEKIFQSDEQIPEEIIIGEEWEAHQNPDDDYKLQNAFGAPSVGAHIEIVVRAYYQKGAGSSKGLRDGEGGYAYSEGGSEGNFDLPTAVMEILGGKQVVDVTYVNTLGMQSSEPFNGMNIVVVRYNDGSITTTKVMR